MTGSIHIVLVVHTLVDEVRALYESLRDPRVFWHIFLHSRKQEVMDLCAEIAQDLNVYYYPYGENRGLARSWNEGLNVARKMKAGHLVIANDDIRATKQHLFHLCEVADQSPEMYMVSAKGQDLRTGEFKDLRMALCVFNKIAFDLLTDKAGRLFDEQFEPIYYEDLDLYYRARLKGMARLIIPHSYGFEHLGSATRYRVNNEGDFMDQFLANQRRYIAKWGGDGTQGSETFLNPYNLEVNHP